MHIALHISLVLVHLETLKSRDSHRGLEKRIASQTCIARLGKLTTGHHGVGNFYLVNSKKLQIGIGIGKFAIIN